jgi:serine protease Do
MKVFNKMRQQKLLSVSLLLVTLCIGIVIGTLMNTKVHAARGQAVAPDASQLTIPSISQLGNEFTKLAKKLEPSVVYITADFTPKAVSNPHGRNGQGQEDDDQQAPGNGDEGSDLFKRFFRNGPGGGETAPRAMRRQEQSGTGFIVDRNGYIVTNNHVVSKVDHIRVRLHTDDPTDYRARIIGVDPETDLAIIKIDPRSPLTPVTIGNSDGVQVGDWAVAIGSPFGLEASVTAGIVSALGRDIGALQLQRFIQTDAAINPGNSGGPLLNIRGEVIGVNTMIATQSGGYQGIGFALPMNMVVRVYNDIIREGKVVRGSIGVEWNKTDKPELLRALGAHAGVLVQRVRPGGPADKAGLKEEDIIVALNGKSVKDGEDLVGRVSELPVGTQAEVTVDRDGKNMNFKVGIQDRAEVFKNDERLGAVPKEEEDVPAKPEGVTQARFGMKIRTLTDSDREGGGLQGKNGVLVMSIDEGSFAEDIGMEEKDVIISINRQPVASIDDVHKIQASLKPGDAVAFRVIRGAQGGGRRGGGATSNSFFLSGTLPSQ